MSLHDRAQWAEHEGWEALHRLLYPEEYDGGEDQAWDGAADYLEVIASIVSDEVAR